MICNRIYRVWKKGKYSFMKNFSNSYQKFVFGLEQINEAVAESPKDFVYSIEENYQSQIHDVAQHILRSNKRYRVATVSGPSASGKTTTALMIKKELQKLGSGAVIISLDDFYKERHEIEVYSDDNMPDYESPDALNISSVKQCISDILTKGYCDIPKFDFVEKKSYKNYMHVELKENQVAIIEGIHGLNPIFTNELPEDSFVKIYVSVKQGIFDYGGMVISNRNIRLVRRLVRDFGTRKSHPQTTLSMWDNVCKGQSMYIYPFKRTSDLTINSLHLYELCVLNKIAIPLLKEVKENSLYFKSSLKLISALERFNSLDINLVPKNSLLREFIG